MVRNIVLDVKRSFKDGVSPKSTSAVESNSVVGSIMLEDVRRSDTGGEVVVVNSICGCADRVELVDSANVGAIKDGVGCSCNCT